VVPRADKAPKGVQKVVPRAGANKVHKVRAARAACRAKASKAGNAAPNNLAAANRAVGKAHQKGVRTATPKLKVATWEAVAIPVVQTRALNGKATTLAAPQDAMVVTKAANAANRTGTGETKATGKRWTGSAGGHRDRLRNGRTENTTVTP
jgi:hypothetical protein